MIAACMIGKRAQVVGVIRAVCFGVLLIGCQPGTLQKETVRTCGAIDRAVDLSARIDTLNLLSEAFAARCDELVVQYGAQARSRFRHKSFSVTREATNVFVPDGTFVDYVMESYERGYLSILMSVSYIRLQKPEEGKVELRELDHELFASIYNFGEDPVNLLLSAVLWEHVGDIREARVDWLRLRDFQGASKGNSALRAFAERRVHRIDSGEEQAGEWQVYRVGRFPGLDWDLQFSSSTSGYFSIAPKQPFFMESCASATGLRLSTKSWFDKIAMRHSHAYHPLLNVQTWIRLPLGLTYSLIPVAAGAGVMVGGCMIDMAGDGKGALCELSVVGGMAIMSTAPKVLEGALRPDLRHWEDVPAAIVVTRASAPALEPCLANLRTDVQRML